MALCIFCLFLLLSLALLGMGMKGVGCDHRSLLRMMTGSFQQFFSSILDAWRFLVLAQIAEREGFRCVQFADFKGSLRLLTSFHLRERDTILLRAILCVGVWNGFLLGRAQKEDVPCQFCGKKDGDGHLFLGVHLFHFCYMFGNSLSFSSLMSIDRSQWPRCLL